MERNDDSLIDLPALAAHLGVNRRTVERMVAEGRIPGPVRYGGLPRWRWGVIREWQRECEILERQRATIADNQRQSTTNEPEGEIPPSGTKKRG